MHGNLTGKKTPVFTGVLNCPVDQSTVGVAGDASEQLPIGKQAMGQTVGDGCVSVKAFPILPASAVIMSLFHRVTALLIKYIISCDCTSPFAPSYLSSVPWMYVVIILVAPWRPKMRQAPNCFR